MLLVHILFVLFFIDQSPPIRTSRVPNSEPSTCVLEVDSAGTQIHLVANDVDFTNLTVPKAVAALANATTPPDMQRNVSSASAAPKGSVAAQLSSNIISGVRAILGPLQEMPQAERGAYMLTQRILPKNQAAMIELRQKHESAEILMRASMLEAETQKEQNASYVMEAQYEAKLAGLEAKPRGLFPNPVKMFTDYVGREIEKEVLKDAPSATTMLTAAQTTADAFLFSEDFLDWAYRTSHIPSDVETLSTAIENAGDRRFNREDILRVKAQLTAVKNIQRDFHISEKDAWRMLKENGATVDVHEADRRVRMGLTSEIERQREEREANARLSQAWNELVLQKCREEFPQLLTVKNPKDRSQLYLPWKIDAIFARNPFPKYEDVSKDIRMTNPTVADNPYLQRNPRLEDVQHMDMEIPDEDNVTRKLHRR